MTSTEQLTLADFLLARIAEDEALLHRDDREPHSAHLTDLIGTVKPEICPTCRGITLFGQRRALAECEAKRRLINRIFAEAVLVDTEYGEDHTADQIRAGCGCYGEEWARTWLANLALPYADHPDYRPEWSA